MHMCTFACTNIHARARACVYVVREGVIIKSVTNMDYLGKWRGKVTKKGVELSLIHI